MRFARIAWNAILALLKEISDEKAYERHLIATGRPHTPDEWRRFWDGRLAKRFQRAKCC